MYWEESSFPMKSICRYVIFATLFSLFFQSFHLFRTVDIDFNYAKSFTLDIVVDDFIGTRNQAVHNRSSLNPKIREKQAEIASHDGDKTPDEKHHNQETETVALPVQNIIIGKSSEPKLALISDQDQIQVSMPGDLSNSTIYKCGYEDGHLIYQHIYPELKDKIKNAVRMNRRKTSKITEEDVLLLGSGGYCGAPPKLTTKWFENKFKGTVIQINRESFIDGDAWKDLNDTSTIPKNQYHLGFVADGCQSLRVFYMAQFFVLGKELWNFFLQEEKKPISTRERFLIYTSSNCVDYRENAFDAIALANPTKTAEYSSGCFGNKRNDTKAVRYAPTTKGSSFNDNWRYMHFFRFCLVMENANVEGYITEKIILAFAGGCIPIYYGTTEIFDIFNPKSFIYYDIYNPQSALDEIVRLEGNATAYDEVLAEPIFLEGNKTIQKYFSLSDEIIPDAMLKKRIRNMVHSRCKM